MSDYKKNKSFVFYESYMSSIDRLKDDSLKLEILNLIMHYGIEKRIIENVSDIALSIFESHKIQMDYSFERRKNAIENGKNGGAPKGNDNASKNRNNQNQPKTTNQYNYDSENNLNVNANANVNVDVNANGDVNLNEDVNENGIVKGRNISSLCSNDFKYLSTIFKIDKEMIQELYINLSNNDFRNDSTGDKMNTYSDFYDYIKEIKEYQEQ